MLKTTVKTLAFLLLFSTVIISCKKKNDQKSKTTLLTQKEWIILKFETKVNTAAWDDDVLTWLACEKDDKYIFKTNNTVEFNEGATKCNAADPQSQTSAWAFVENESKLTLEGDTWTITQLDDNTMILSLSETVGADTYYIKITFTH